MRVVILSKVNGGEDLDLGGFWGLVGIEAVSAMDGVATARVMLGGQHLNYNGVVHGGVISSLVDSAAGFAVRSLRTHSEVAARPHATANLHVSYLAGAKGSELRAEARVVKAGRTAVFTEVSVVDDRGAEVARGSVTFVIGARRQDAG